MQHAITEFEGHLTNITNTNIQLQDEKTALNSTLNEVENNLELKNE
jgi:hypothetical protein